MFVLGKTSFTLRGNFPILENGWTIISSQFSLEGIGFRFLNVSIIEGVSYRSS
ncbi:hypothetical protein LEP1GSC043_3336 [Leptospira weilii str. Ecochallenge]|uniref:Uncharacterized protein n=1 Tax=Leptospira weilii str. Ecochallenge TaxID=1049986 RepID=N1U5C5_9LEPT|nr:hypothetical protein LEP1GSC043_3336 [Leptospira weilii str. Ecochallenge]